MSDDRGTNFKSGPGTMPMVDIAEDSRGTASVVVLFGSDVTGYAVTYLSATEVDVVIKRLRFTQTRLREGDRPNIGLACSASDQDARSAIEKLRQEQP